MRTTRRNSLASRVSLKMEQPAKKTVSHSLEHEDDANKFLMSIFTREEDGEAEWISKITDLKITIDGTNWTDYDDDIWAMALRAFAPLSQNLEHLHIIVKGSNLFTQFNYVKPVVSKMVPYGIAEEDSSSDNESPSESSLSFRGKASPRRSPRGATGPRKAKRVQELSPTSKSTVLRYNKKNVPADDIKLHITSEKAIITALLCFNKPLSRITISGPMELALRRHLITTLCPDWINSAHNVTQLGYDAADCDVLDETERRETAIMSTGTEMAKLQIADASLQTGEDFGMTREHSNAAQNSGMVANWVVPTGSAGRQVYGWKATVASAWKGPRERSRTSFG